MRRSPALLLALPALLVAQDKAPETQVQTLTQRFKAESPAIEKLMKEHSPEEALAKVTALVPAVKLVFDKSTPAAGLASSSEYSTLMLIYSMAGKAALAGGHWEQALELFQKAQDAARENATETAAALAPSIENWKNAIANGKKELEAGAARRAELRAKAKRDERDDAELKNFDVFENNVRIGPIQVAKIQGSVDVLKADAESFTKAIDGVKKTLEEEQAQITKAPFNGDKARYVAAVMNPTNLAMRQTQDDKLNFLFRLSVLDAKNVKVRREIDKQLGRTPAPEPKTGKGKKAGKKTGK